MIGTTAGQRKSLLDDYCAQLGSLLERRHTERVLIVARQNAEGAARLAEEALRQARATDRAKTTFLANVTHELRTPLNAIIGFSEIIQSAGGSAAEHAAYGKYIHEAGTRLLGIVNDVLTLARIEAGKLALDEQVASLDEVLRASVRALLPSAAAISIDIQREPDLDHLVLIDPGKIKQVFIHLLSNAVKFTPEGGRIELTSRYEPAGDLVIAVRDTGCGIPPEHLERVLEPFGQVEDHLTRENEGVGLGLPLARAMIGLHGGRLALDSILGLGTTVEILLPAARLQTLALKRPS
jgi:signal transduction histidine kinase